MRSIFLVLAILLTETSLSFAQGHMGTPQEQQACRRDAQRVCRQQLGDDGAVQQCLQQNRTRLSKSCQKVFASHGMSGSLFWRLTPARCNALKWARPLSENSEAGHSSSPAEAILAE